MYTFFSLLCFLVVLFGTSMHCAVKYENVPLEKRLSAISGLTLAIYALLFGLTKFVVFGDQGGALTFASIVGVWIFAYCMLLSCALTSGSPGIARLGRKSRVLWHKTATKVKRSLKRYTA